MGIAYRSTLGEPPTGNAVVGDVLYGKTFSNADGTDKVGTMPNNGAVAPTALDPGGSYTIPAGYHNGQGAVSAKSNTATYTASSRGAALDMGAANLNRYVNTNGVPNSNTGTYTFPANDTGGTKDLGEANNYRYVNAQNVYAKGLADGKVNVKINMAQGYGMVYDHLDFANAANNSSRLISSGVGTYDLCDDFSCTITAGTWPIYTFTIKKAKSYIVYGATYNGTNYTTLTILSLPAGASVRMMDPNVFDQYGLRFIACIAD